MHASDSSGDDLLLPKYTCHPPNILTFREDLIDRFQKELGAFVGFVLIDNIDI
jgi:hypothetical protein